MIDKALLRYHIEKANYTLAKLAEETGMNPSTMSRKLNGASEFTRTEMQKIREVLLLSEQEFTLIFFS